MNLVNVAHESFPILSWHSAEDVAARPNFTRVKLDRCPRVWEVGGLDGVEGLSEFFPLPFVDCNAR